MEKQRGKKVGTGTMMMLPAKPGTCAMCARDHPEELPHDLQSLFYGMRFKLKYGRDPTWADAAAHIAPDVRELWKTKLRELGHEWTECDDPIAEPYAKSDPFRSEP